MRGKGTDKLTLAVCFGQFGPYHHARVAALQGIAEHRDNKTTGQRDHRWRVIPVQIAAATSTYAWEDVQGTAGLKDQEPSLGDGSRQSRGQTKRPEDQATNAVSSPPRAAGLLTLCEGTDEAASPLDVFLEARKLFRTESVSVAFLPSYSPARFFALFAAAKSLGIRTVMMNESHAGTEQATGWKRWIKRQIVKRFDAAFVGGEPHKRHFASLGIPVDKIFTGYDAVDNDFFASRADDIRAAAKKSVQFSVGSVQQEEMAGEVRSMEHGARRVEQDASSKDQETKRQSVREAYGLPERYFLSLGRMVEKKNLSTLVEAYARFARATGERSKAETGNLKPELPETAEGGDDATTSAEPRLCETGLSQNCELKTEHYPPALVFVGSGELEAALREQASGLGLKVVDRTNLRAGKTLETRDSLPATRHEEDRGAVYFYGFRQIEENPVFYALAEAFVLPSLKEEWGLVVNEAMACSLPVIVSRTAGCAEDLVPASGSMERGARSMESGEGAGSLSPQRSTLNSLEERSNGFVFDPKSSDALSEALRRIADQKTNSQVFEPQMAPRQTARGRAEGKPSDQETNGLTEMGRRSREIVAKFSCENFARQALRAAEAAGS